MEIKIVIPSLGRFNNVSTVKAVDNCSICCTQKEYAKYKENYPDNEIIPHPDNLIGLPATRQWIYDKFGDVFMLDDDVERCERVYQDPLDKIPSKVDPKTAYDIIQTNYYTTKNLGLYLYGFLKDANPVQCKPFDPLRMSGTINGCAFGILKTDRLYFDKRCIAVEDYFISLLNAYYYRACFIDRRYAFPQKKDV